MFGDRDSGAYLHQFAWTKIVRHQMVKGGASPDDPALADYWAARRRRNTPPLRPASLRLLQAQHGRCPLCGTCSCTPTSEPQSPSEWEQWLTGHPHGGAQAKRSPSSRTQASRTIVSAFRSIHIHCHRWPR